MLNARRKFGRLAEFSKLVGREGEKLAPITILKGAHATLSSEAVWPGIDYGDVGSGRRPNNDDAREKWELT